MKTRMTNPAFVLGATPPIQSLMQTVFTSGLEMRTLDLVSLRVGQLNACQLCIGQSMAKEGDDRLDRVLDWPEQTCFTRAERAALQLTDEATRLGRRYESVTDETWDEVEQCFNERQRAGLVLMIAAMNMFTRLNVVTRQTTADWS